MKKNFLKIPFLSIINVGYGYVAFLILPASLLAAFNRTKGYVNNPDGEIFVFIGWLIMLLIPILFFVINMVIIRKLLLRRKFLALSFIAFLIGAVIGIAVTNMSYSINYTNIWKEIF